MPEHTGYLMPGRVVIRLVDDGVNPFKGDVYIREWNHDDNGALKHENFTRHIGEAMKFESVKAAHAFWYGQSRSQPLRPLDGEPNRPMTQFTPAFESVEDAAFWKFLVNPNY